MSKFAPVAPTGILEGLKTLGILGDYHLLLAHDIVAYPGTYRRIFGNMLGAYVILDNSVIELGKPASSEMIQEAINIVKPSVVVLPDYMEEEELTVKASFKTAAEWIEAGIETPFMVVPQGDNPLRCLNRLVKIPNVTSVGIPRVYVKQFGSRYKLACEFAEKYPLMKFHLLGFSDSILDDVRCARLPFIEGIDSAVPTRMGYNNIEMTMLMDDPGPRGDYWDCVFVSPMMERNLNLMRTWIGA